MEMPNFGKKERLSQHYKVLILSWGGDGVFFTNKSKRKIKQPFLTANKAEQTIANETLSIIAPSARQFSKQMSQKTILHERKQLQILLKFSELLF